MRHIILIWFTFLTFATNAQYHVVVLGSKYPNNQQALFLSDVETAKAEILLRPPLTQRQSQIEWHVGTGNNQFGCKYNQQGVGQTALVCDYQKIYKKANEVYSGWDVILVVVNNMGYGSGGNPVAIVGTGDHTFDPRAFGSICLHELGHCWGFDHLNGTIMGDATNGGQALINRAFNFSQMDVINNMLNTKAGVYPSDDPIDVHIESPYNGQIFTTSSFITFWANTNFDNNIFKYQIIVTRQSDNGYLIGEFTLWARNHWNPQYDIKRDIGTLPAGNYTIEIRVFNIIGTICSESVNIIVE